MAISSVGAAPVVAATAKSQITVFINSTQSWTAPTGVTSVDLFLVAGGGGGGGAANTTAGNNGGGGGGGGVTICTVPVTPGTGYTVTIGGGGGSATDNNPGNNGSNSTFGSLAIAYGGGYGFSGGNVGVSTRTGSGGGNSGGNTVTSGIGGAGGGAGPYMFPYLGSGSTGVFSQLGVNGGVTLVQGTYGNISAGNSTTQYYPPNPGIGGYGAGGGGGCAYTTMFGYGGPNAGNGAYQNSIPASAAVANRGGGGGGGLYQGGYLLPSNGGSGVCIIKYWA